MTVMTTHERVARMYEHRQADRVPITDSPWQSTIARWHREGLPEQTSYADYFGLDKFVSIGADNSPRYPEKVLEQTEDYAIRTTRWGQTIKTWNNREGVPQFLDFRVRDADSWAAAKKRMQPTRNRIDWNRLAQNYRKWREDGAWVKAGFWFGFDVTHSWMVGTERVLVAMLEDPDWVMDMFNHYLDVDIALFEMVWQAGYRFDEVHWPDDMGYKGHQFFSLDTYRELLKPVHKRAADWAHAKGLKVHLHSCGDVSPIIPDLIEIGIDMLNPLEVKAGMDPVRLKAQYGRQLGFHGGLNAVLFTRPETLWKEMRDIVPMMKKDGGYIVSSDHSVPDSVGLEEFKTFVTLAKELGSYE